LLFGPFAFIGPGHRGVEVVKGRVTGTVFPEGWYFYNSITKDIVVFDTRTHTDEADADAASNDQQDVKVKVAVTYRINPDAVAEILRTIGREEDVKTKIIDPQVQESVKAATAKHNIEEMLDKRVEIKQQIFDDLSLRLAKYGAVLQEVALKDIGFSEEFEKAIEHKVIAEQQRQQAQFEADATVKRAEAKAKEQELLKQTLTVELLQRLALEKWNGVLPVYMGGGAPVPFLNISP
ncbi:MAG TPA: membrane protease subunit, stomatin/prohibitin, partial [Porphyromonadaceae bacterium]|nr:membrane protease subunit, stomatin/prohibitin [Porphyromonadaceae bacterium]